MLKAFTIIENMVAMTLILIVFMGASLVFLKFSGLPQWQEQFAAKNLIERDYEALGLQKIVDGIAELQDDKYHVKRKINKHAARLFLVNYKVSRNDRLILEKNYFYLESE